MAYKTLLFFLLATNLINAQFVLDQCPSETTCIETDLSTMVTIPAPTGTTSDVLSCEGSSNSQMNLKFEATSEIFYFEFLWDTDEEISAGIVSDCGDENYCISSVACDNSGSIFIEGNLIPGRTYIVYIDGCNHTSPVEVEVNLDLSFQTELFYEAYAFETFQECTIEEHPVVCANEPFVMNLLFEEQEYWNNRDAIWYFTYEGPETGEFETDYPGEIILELPVNGTYEICLQNVQLDCRLYYPFICLTVEVGSESTEYGTYDVCQHDLESGNWVPDENWLGEPITESGEYMIQGLGECDCLGNQSITVNEVAEIEAEVEIRLCPQDYPYDFMGEEDYNYSETNIEDLVYLFEGSMVEDYDGNPCDSVVYLILINDEPQDRCSSCNLPLSLEKSKIVFCLPFDNSTVDVSGRNTIVHSTGIDYDDNGSKENDYWEALLDGDDDFISVPYIDDLNTSVFSFNFQLNKDESFESGPKETIISKGDASEGNLRYDVSIEKVNETIYNMVGTFYSENYIYNLGIENLQVYSWYDIAYVVDTDSISLYLDGAFYKSITVDEALKGNDEDLLIGTLLDNNINTQYYNGRLDNFKYWKQKLSGQDVYFLHYPEKEFELSYDYFLSCCSQATFRDKIIDISNPLDSVIVPNASPTGYDSVYILNYVQADSRPVLNASVAPQDVVVQYNQECSEICQAEVQWTADLDNLFTDNCGEVSVTQSHPNTLVLDESISYVEVLLTGMDNCGQTTDYRFALELECVPSTVMPIPEDNVFAASINDECVPLDSNTYCKFSDVFFQPQFIDVGQTESQPYSIDAGFECVMSVNGFQYNLTEWDVENGIVFPELVNEGAYEVCLETVSNNCDSKTVMYCETVYIKGTEEVDYGTIEVCRENISEGLPQEISEDLKNLILSNPQETTISVTVEDECGCGETEKLKLKINDDVFTEMSASICEGEIYDGETEPGVYTTVLEATNGCDSIVTLELSVLPKSYTDVFVEICPDSMYMGYTSTGEYEILETNQQGCDSLVTLFLEVLEDTHPDCFLSSVEYLDEQSLIIYPNPVSDFLYINNIEETLLIKEITILGISGKKLQSTRFYENGIDVSSLDSGLYLLKIDYVSNVTKVLKFVKG